MKHEQVFDNGVWGVGLNMDGRVYIDSTDFAHDVRLYVDGDFESNQQKQEYANHIAQRLNSTRNWESK